MRRHANTVLQEALTLPEQERAEIAGALLESLEPELESDVETAWRQEVAVRIAGSGSRESRDDPLGRDPRCLSSETE